jgi:hypothetical protein
MQELERLATRSRSCHGTSRGSTAHDCCALTKGVVSGSSLDGPITCALDDWRDSRSRNCALRVFAQRRRARWGSATRPPRERGLHAGGASGGTRTSWRCRSAEANASMRVQWFFDALNPVTHLEAYERDVAIAFLCGAADLHVPAEAAGRFRTALCDRDPRRPIGCGSSCTWVSTTSTRRGTSGCTRRRSSGWRRAGRRADRTAAEDDGTGSSV